MPVNDKLRYARKFIVSDTPRHIQYKRNMVSGASTAEPAIILIEAQRGALTQSKRHGFIASLLRIPHYHLEHVSAGSTRKLVDFGVPVQMALRPNPDFRGYMGQVASGTIRPGDLDTMTNTPDDDVDAIIRYLKVKGTL